MNQPKLKFYSKVSFTLGMWLLIAVISSNAVAKTQVISQARAQAPIQALEARQEADRVEVAKEPKVVQPAQPSASSKTAKVTSKVTAYSEIDSCHTGASCLMASGKKAYVGAVACPRKVSLGTKVKIGDKTYTCEDRTAMKYDGRYDIFMGYGVESHQKALEFGIKNLSVTVTK